MKYCAKCGTALPDDSEFCTNCGTAAASPTESVPQTEPTPPLQTKKVSPIPIIAAVLAVLLLIGAAFIIRTIVVNNAKEELQSTLLKDWSRIESGDSGSLYRLELDFSYDTIEYIFDGSFFVREICTYDYEILSGKTIRVNDYDTVYTIKFNDDRTMMTITPALTSSDASENWFCHDD